MGPNQRRSGCEAASDSLPALGVRSSLQLGRLLLARAPVNNSFPPNTTSLEGSGTQFLRALVSNTFQSMVFGTRNLKCWVLGPSGITRLLSGILCLHFWLLVSSPVTMKPQKYILYAQRLFQKSLPSNTTEANGSICTRFWSSLRLNLSFVLGEERITNTPNPLVENVVPNKLSLMGC